MSVADGDRQHSFQVYVVREKTEPQGDTCILLEHTDDGAGVGGSNHGAEQPNSAVSYHCKCCRCWVSRDLEKRSHSERNH